MTRKRVKKLLHDSVENGYIITAVLAWAGWVSLTIISLMVNNAQINQKLTDIDSYVKQTAAASAAHIQTP